MNISSTQSPSLSRIQKPHLAQAPAKERESLPRADSWELNEKKGSWVKGSDGLTYRRTMSNFGAAVGAFASHFLVVGAGAALGASLGAGLGTVSWGLGVAGAVGGGLAGAALGGKLQGTTLWGRDIASKAGASVGNLVGRGMHALKIPLRSNHVETAKNFSIKSLNRYGADMSHTGHALVSEAEAESLIAKMEPGDIVLTGDNRSTPFATATALLTGRSSFTHALIYQGDGLAVESVVEEGVREKSLKEILTSKNHAVALRPDYLEGQASEVVAFGRELVGKPYDFKFSGGNENWYCSELVFAAVKEAAPQVEFDTRKVFGKEIIVPNDLLFTEDAGVVGEVGEGLSYLDRMMGKFISPQAAELNSGSPPDHG